MKKLSLLVCALLVTVSAFAQRPTADTIPFRNKTLVIQPITHATFMMNYDGKTLYVDPTGGAASFAGLPSADIILVTDIHGDHLDTATLQSVVKPSTKLIVPQAVADKLPQTLKKQVIVLANGQNTKLAGVEFAAIPMYNLPETPDAFHTKGRGNGYVISADGGKIYISGDTEDIPEMRSLKDIDIAFLCMNLPYTMDVKQAAQGVLAFNPKIVYPYHYRGQDTKVFKEIVNTANPAIDVRLRNWYPGK